MRRIPELESLRGLMAAWVMLGHIWLTIPGASFPFVGAVLSRNGEAVYVFMILSGFVIMNLLDGSREGYTAYLTRRFFRLFPVYFILLLVSLALLDLSMQVFSDPLWKSQRNDQRIGILIDTREYFWSHLAAHATLVHGMIPARLLPSAEYAMLGQAWSISLEWQFYVVAPLAFSAIVRDPVRGSLMVLGIALVAHFMLRYVAGEAFLPTTVAYFIVGSASYFLWCRQEGFQPAATAISAALAATLAALYGQPAVAIWCAVLGLLILQRQDGSARLPALACRLLRHPALMWVGTISYSLYLVHMIPLVLAMTLMPAGIQGVLPQGVWLFATVVPASFFLSWLLFRIVEQPGIVLGRRVAAVFQRAG